ncbi:unnamed protein product, partial [Mesorhabditis spiculigera]
MTSLGRPPLHLPRHPDLLKEGSHYTSAHREELGFRIKVYPRLNDAMKKGGPGARMIRDAIDYYGIK